MFLFLGYGDAARPGQSNPAVLTEKMAQQLLAKQSVCKNRKSNSKSFNLPGERRDQNPAVNSTAQFQIR